MYFLKMYQISLGETLSLCQIYNWITIQFQTYFTVLSKCSKCRIIYIFLKCFHLLFKIVFIYSNVINTYKGIYTTYKLKCIIIIISLSTPNSITRAFQMLVHSHMCPPPTLCPASSVFIILLF